MAPIPDVASSFAAALFDLDGVLTPTAEVHRRAWSKMFNAFLAETGQRPYAESDYFAYIDGKPRYDGVRDFLAARGIALADGSPTDPPEANTVAGLGNRKNVAFNAVLASEGVRPYPGSLRWMDHLLANGVAMAVVSSSANAEAVLRAAGLRHRFTVLVDGRLAQAERLPGKPAPDTYLRAAQLLGVRPEDAVVYEDAVSGVAAGQAGGFGLVIGVDRGAGVQALTEAGATLVVSDLDELLP